MNPGRRFVIGDIHGAYKAMMECFEKASFDYENDVLYCLGDVCDGWPQVRESIDELMKIKNLIYIIGNHDYWTLEWMHKNITDRMWIMQGGKATLDSYKDEIPLEHTVFLENALNFFEEDRRLFVHGGFIPDLNIRDQDQEELMWDRSLVQSAMHLKNNNNDEKITSYEEIYVGHTPTINYGALKPIKACEIWLMDTGAGWPGGVLSMIDIDNKELFQSSIVNDLYPKYKGRGEI